MQSKRLQYFLFAFLITQIIAYSLDTNLKSILNLNDTVNSPLGYYKLRLQKNCTFSILKFNNITNQYKESFALDVGLSGGTTCSYLNLSVANQGLYTNDGKIFKKPFVNNQQYNRFKLKINDIGVVYLVSFYNGPDNNLQYNVDNFQNNQISADSSIVYQLPAGASYKNNNGWQFTIQNSILNINNTNQNIPLTKNVNLEGYLLKQTGLTDPQGQTRYAIAPGLTMRPKASKSSCGGPEGVFMKFDDYLPIARIYDEDKYLVGYYAVDQNIKSFCPPKLFQFNGQCLSYCPKPYYKQLRGKHGSCVLKCQQNMIINQNLKTCTLSSQQPKSSQNLNIILNRKCPSGSTQYQYGCICVNSQFYDFQNNICLNTCPQNTFGIQGLCLKCPSNCKGCSNNSITRLQYLTCKQCSQGYSGSQCSINANTCQQIKNCAICSKDKNGIQVCQKCSPFYILSSHKLLCQFQCASDQAIISGNIAQGYCKKIGAENTGSPQDFIGGYYNGITYIVRKSNTCGQGFKIFRDRCVSSCPQGYDMNNQYRCICQPGFATFTNQTCVKISDINLYQIGMYYSSNLNTFLNCPIGCINCDSNYCYKCSPQYILVATSSSSSCHQNSLHFNCNSEYYTYNRASRTCITNNLLKVISNITNCQVQIRNKCITCKNGYYLQQNSCVLGCKTGYSGIDGQCIKNNQNCYMPEMIGMPVRSAISSAVISSPIYQAYSSNNVQISNDPITEILSIRNQLGIPPALNSPITATLYQPKFSCILSSIPTTVPITDSCPDKTKPYLLSNKTCVSQCPPYFYVYTALNNTLVMCLPYTSCASRSSGTPFQMPDGTCVATCPIGMVPTQFGSGSKIQCVSLTDCQKINVMTPFQLANTQCASACPAGSTPYQQNNNLLCKNLTSSQIPKSLSIDSSVFQLGRIGQQIQRLFYFVVDQPLNFSSVDVNYYIYNHSKLIPKLSQTGQPLSPNSLQVTQFNNKTYIGITTLADQVVLDLSKNIKQFQSVNGNRLASSIYGVNVNSNRIQNTRSWLAIIAYVLSLILIIYHSIYIGNQLLYKVDNFLIFAQSLYYFSFVHLMINSTVAQYYYGFLWSHFGFFPNYFQSLIPTAYMQGNIYQNNNFLPNSYRLLTGDANFIRNAGFSFSLLLTFLFVYLIIIGILLLLKYVCGKYDIWYKRIAKQTLFAGIQFVSMNIFYWAVAHLLCNRSSLFSGKQNQPASFVAYRTSCTIAAIVWICLYGVYMIVRFNFNKIGGLYMFKRLVFATILAASAYHDNGDNSYKLFLISLIAAQLLFMALRFIIEKPYLRRQKVFIILQSVLMTIAYLILYLWNDTGVVSIYVSLVLFLFVLLLTEDLMDVYLDNKDQYYNDNVKILPGLRQKQIIRKADYQNLDNNLGSVPQSDRRFRQQ